MFFLPYLVDVAMDRVPFTNWVVIGFTCILSMVMWGVENKRTTDVDIDPLILKTSDPRRLDEALEKLERMSREPQAPLLSLQRKHFAFYQLVSHIFIHGDIWHLGGNMLVLFLFGNAINAKLGHWPFLGLYVVFGILAGLCWLALGKGEALLGASGAIMGICGVFLVLYPKNEVSIFWVFFFFIFRSGTFEMASYWLMLFWFAGDLWGCFSGSQGEIAYVAHLAGAIAGVAVGIFLVVNDLVDSPAGEENLLQAWGLRESSDRWDYKGHRRLPKKRINRKKADS